MTTPAATSPPLKEEFNRPSEIGGVFVDIDQKFRNADFSVPLTDFVDTLEETHQQHWAGRHSPGGSSWPPLAASTIARKGHDQPLVLTSALVNAMTNRNAPGHVGEVMSRGLTYGTDIEYAGFHQDGTSRIPQREFAGMSDETVDKLASKIADALVEKLKYTIRG